MHLTQDQRHRVELWLKERQVGLCPRCGLENFCIGAVIAATSMLQIFCGNCDHVVLFNAKAILLDYDKQRPF